MYMHEGTEGGVIMIKKTKAQKEGPTPPRGVKETNVKT